MMTWHKLNLFQWKPSLSNKKLYGKLNHFKTNNKVSLLSKTVKLLDRLVQKQVGKTCADSCSLYCHGYNNLYMLRNIKCTSIDSYIGVISWFYIYKPSLIDGKSASFITNNKINRLNKNSLVFRLVIQQVDKYIFGLI
jgi:hypothetical protein